jgi:hypothetical protein
VSFAALRRTDHRRVHVFLLYAGWSSAPCCVPRLRLFTRTSCTSSRYQFLALDLIGRCHPLTETRISAFPGWCRMSCDCARQGAFYQRIVVKKRHGEPPLSTSVLRRDRPSLGFHIQRRQTPNRRPSLLARRFPLRSHVGTGSTFVFQSRPLAGGRRIRPSPTRSSTARCVYLFAVTQRWTRGCVVQQNNLDFGTRLCCGSITSSPLSLPSLFSSQVHQFFPTPTSLPESSSPLRACTPLGLATTSSLVRYSSPASSIDLLR